ncbi:MAG: hypothetical protein GX127_01990 [Eubacteriaceae bacterium]|jgi:hypothetical protein|nr:hypothetical protein [Eubacteriaceae bacterium]
MNLFDILKRSSPQERLRILFLVMIILFTSYFTVLSFVDTPSSNYEKVLELVDALYTEDGQSVSEKAIQNSGLFAEATKSANRIRDPQLKSEQLQRIDTAKKMADIVNAIDAMYTTVNNERVLVRDITDNQMSAINQKLDVIQNMGLEAFVTKHRELLSPAEKQYHARQHINAGLDAFFEDGANRKELLYHADSDDCEALREFLNDVQNPTLKEELNTEINRIKSMIEEQEERQYREWLRQEEERKRLEEEQRLKEEDEKKKEDEKKFEDGGPAPMPAPPASE